jgi:hypothetical protein
MPDRPYRHIPKATGTHRIREFHQGGPELLTEYFEVPALALHVIRFKAPVLRRPIWNKDVYAFSRRGIINEGSRRSSAPKVQKCLKSR